MDGEVNLEVTMATEAKDCHNSMRDITLSEKRSPCMIPQFLVSPSKYQHGNFDQYFTYGSCTVRSCCAVVATALGLIVRDSRGSDRLEDCPYLRHCFVPNSTFVDLEDKRLRLDSTSPSLSKCIHKQHDFGTSRLALSVTSTSVTISISFDYTS
jgi:hypothetical protein